MIRAWLLELDRMPYGGASHDEVSVRWSDEPRAHPELTASERESIREAKRLIREYASKHIRCSGVPSLHDDPSPSFENAVRALEECSF